MPPERERAYVSAVKIRATMATSKKRMKLAMTGPKVNNLVTL
jgi:hypothetical protein